MTVSFRMRLTAIAALVVAGVLAAVLALAWSGVREVEIDRLDARLCLEARRLAWQPFGADQMGRVEADVMGKLRLAAPSQLMLGIDRAGVAAYRSPNWHPELGSDRLEWSPRAERKDTGAAESPRADRPRPESGGAGPAPREPVSRPECSLAAFETGAARWHAARVSGPAGVGYVAADVAAPADEILGVLRGTLGLVVPVALALVALGAWLLAVFATRPVERLHEAMKSVSGKDLHRRLPSAGEDREFRDLIAAYNGMLERLQASFEQASRFSADAAHELRTPLTILQGRLEQAIRKSEHRAIQADLADMQEEIGRLASITRKLLLLSRADAGHLALHRVPVDLTELLDTLVSDAQMLAADKKVTHAVEPGLVLQADEIMLRQMLNNLVSNAIRYCQPGGWIEIAAARRDRDVVLTFANATEPLAAGVRQRLFDRFYRRDPARGRGSEGTGLGLSLAREIARAHGGDLALEDGPPNEFRLTLRLPAG